MDALGAPVFQDIIHNHLLKEQNKYINHNKNITIICPIHGEFKQKPFIHISRHGCKKCGNNSILEPQFIINANKVHNNKYQYKDFLSLTQKCTIICPIHGEFKQIAGKHLSGQGCKKCGSQKYFKKDFVKISNKVHNNNYNYSKINYIDSRHNVDIICPIHGIFSQEPREHLQGAGCPKCVSTISKISQQWLDELGITNREKIIRVVKHSFKVDAIKDNIIYEFYGDYWHGNPKIYNPQDINPSCNKTFGELYRNTIDRENKLKSVGYSVVSMWESEYKEKKMKSEKEVRKWFMARAKKLGLEDDLQHVFDKWDRAIALAPNSEKEDMAKSAILEVQNLLAVVPKDGLTINDKVIIPKGGLND